jgi:hypothetical protein
LKMSGKGICLCDSSWTALTVPNRGALATAMATVRVPRAFVRARLAGATSTAAFALARAVFSPEPVFVLHLDGTRPVCPPG